MSDTYRAKLQVDQLVNDVKKDLAKPKVTLTPEQQCLERANTRIRAAKSQFHIILKQRVIPPTMNELVDLIYPILRQNFNDWSRDDFATLACMHLAIQAAGSLSDHTI